MAGGRANVEAGLQTGLDIVATMAWWDWTAGQNEQNEKETLTTMGEQSDVVIIASIAAFLVLIGAASFVYLRYARLDE